jgi:hypothetical protein
MYYYYYCILRLSAKRYEKLLAIRLEKPLIDKTLDALPLLLFCAPFCLLIIVNTIICSTYCREACLLA